MTEKLTPEWETITHALGLANIASEADQEIFRQFVMEATPAVWAMAFLHIHNEIGAEFFPSRDKTSQGEMMDFARGFVAGMGLRALPVIPEAAEIATRTGSAAVAVAMLTHIAATLQEKGRAVIERDEGYGPQIVQAVRAFIGASVLTSEAPPPQRPTLQVVKDTRPANCRFRLKDEGKPYPRTGCKGCNAQNSFFYKCAGA